ncbi:alpha/beta fold hydrolase [Colwellia piezophila]|uniref:alpha/beta fold hydrolase n=1 Tax=Colwellia piezophila TaxID=211668 RepID=UPI00036DC4A3|nr:alpha/beta hydrolase [Colwellia piezophila]
MTAEIKRHAVKIGDAEISYLEAGSKDNPIALFLHGIPASAELWRSVMIEVSEKGWHCIAPDLPGYGKTRLPTKGNYSLLGAALLLQEWLIQKKYKNVWLIGHDIGGGVAQILMTLDEQLFSHVTLSNCITASSWPVLSVRLMIWMAKFRLFRTSVKLGLFPNSYANWELRRAVFNSACLTPATVSRIFWDSKITDKQGQLAFQNMLASLDPKHTINNMIQLRNVNLPVHLVWGLDDPNQQWKGPGLLLSKIFPSAKITKLPNVGHFLQLESTQSYVSAILQNDMDK